MIQIRNVPAPLHHELKVRAAREGMSLSRYLRREIGKIAAVPTIEEMRARLRGRPPATSVLDTADAARAERGE